MKKVLALVVAALLFAGSPVLGDTIYTIEDTWVNWPGYTGSGEEDIGTPEIEYMNVIVSDEGYLDSVQIAIAGISNTWQEFNSLFINSYAIDSGNTGTEDWDFYVLDGYGRNTSHGQQGLPNWDGIFSVHEGYSYTTASGSGVRAGNPNGIYRDDLTRLSWGGSWVEEGQDGLGYYLWTYSFEGIDIDMSEGGAVAFAPWCANDVVGGEMSTVPEPATMALLGVGLLGLAGIARRGFPA